MATFFTSDTHAFHKNISGPKISQWGSGYRDFNDEVEMTEHLAKQINKTVMATDTLYHLGDWSFGGVDKIHKFREMINCRNIHLIRGNHDHHITVADYWKGINQAQYFNTVQDVLDLQIGSNNFFLSHYAHRVWLGSHKGIIHLYGHSHDSIPDYGKSMDVGIDSAKRILGEYRPFSLQEVTSLMTSKSVEFPDHHDEKTNSR